MKLKRDTKFGGKSTCHLKTGIRNLTIFFYFYKICATKVPTNKTVNNELKKLKNSNILTHQDKTSLFGLLI